MKLLITFISIFIISTSTAFPQKEFQKFYQTKLIAAETDTTIELPEGKFTLTNTLSLEGKKKITIRGKGIDKTILSFKNQTDGAEGIRISNCEEIVLEDFTVQDAKGDAIKAMHVKGIHFKNIKTEWTGEKTSQNGGYGLYPVQCQEVLIEKCIAIGASDAGIYVGQSENIIVRYSKTFNNVAGIEIENSLYVDIYENETYENTSGILIFDLPNLIQNKGGYMKIYNNNIHDNNYPNFSPKWSAVAGIPQGSGIIIIAASEIEIYNNIIRNNQSIGTGVINYFTYNRPPFRDKRFDPYPYAISIHDNQYERQKTKLPKSNYTMAVIRKKYGKQVPHVIYDGIKNPKYVDTENNWLINCGILIENNKKQLITVNNTKP